VSDAEIGSYFHLSPEVIDIINLHNPSMFNAAVKDSETDQFARHKRSSITKLDSGARFVTESGSRTCVNPGVSTPIVSPPIVSTPASAEAYPNHHASDTVTITISREDAERWASDDDHIHATAWGTVDKAIRAALEGER